MWGHQDQPYVLGLDSVEGPSGGGTKEGRHIGGPGARNAPGRPTLEGIVSLQGED